MGARIASVLAGAVPVGSRVTIEGWIRTRRDSKAGLSFLAVHDGSCFDPLQIVAPAELPNYQAEIVKLTSGCAVRVVGELIASQGKGQAVEVRAESVEVVGWVDDPDHYPMQPKRHTMEYLREVAHLRPRTNVIGAVTRVRHTLAQAVHRFFHDQGFFWIHTPIITASDAEGAGQMFRVSTLDLANPPRTPDGKIDFAQDFFGRETRLTVSGQLNVETYCLAMSKVYTFGPTFRAENSNTRAAPGRVLDDRAGGGVRRPRGRQPWTWPRTFLKADRRRRCSTKCDEDLKFFAEVRVDKGLRRRACHAITEPAVHCGCRTPKRSWSILTKSGKTWEYPVSLGRRTCRSEHERFLTETALQAARSSVVRLPEAP